MNRLRPDTTGPGGLSRCHLSTPSASRARTGHSPITQRKRTKMHRSSGGHINREAPTGCSYNQRQSNEQALAIIIRVGLHLSAVTGPGWPLSGGRACPVRVCHRQMLPSSEPATQYSASALKHASSGIPVALSLPEKLCIKSPLYASSSNTLPWVVLCSMSLPSLENLMHEKLSAPPRLGLKVRKGPFSYARTSKSYASKSKGLEGGVRGQVRGACAAQRATRASLTLVCPPEMAVARTTPCGSNATAGRDSSPLPL